MLCDSNGWKPPSVWLSEILKSLNFNRHLVANPDSRTSRKRTQADRLLTTAANMAHQRHARWAPSRLQSLSNISRCLLLLILSTMRISSVMGLPSGAPLSACAPDYTSPHGPAVLSDEVQVEIVDPATQQPVTGYEIGKPLHVIVSTTVC